MKTPLPLATGFALFLAAAEPVRAGLIVERLVVESTAVAGGSSSVTETSSHLTPLGIPLFVTATAVNGEVQALSLQTKGGFFRNRVDVNRGSLGTSESGTAQSIFFLVVGTDTPDTPLVLDFDFLGAQMKGSAYFGFGTIIAGVGQDIQAEIRNTIDATTHVAELPTVWRFGASVQLIDNMWNPVYSTTDSQNIGVPVDTDTPLMTLDEEGNIRSAGLMLELAPFHGTLDFGTLQPGEFFALRYKASAMALSSGAYDLGPDAFANALLVDPFSLGGTPAPQISLRGLTLPSAPTGQPTLILTAVDPPPAPLLHFRLTGLPGVFHSIESSESLAHESWMTDIPAFPMPASGQFDFTAPWVPGQSRFFRGRATP